MHVNALCRVDYGPEILTEPLVEPSVFGSHVACTRGL